MKITKRQLQRIIKEEKSKLLVEMNPRANADRSLGMLANVSTMETLGNSLLDLLQEVEMGAVEEEGVEPEEGEEMARNAAILCVANAFQSAGLVDVYQSLFKLLR